MNPTNQKSGEDSVVETSQRRINIIGNQASGKSRATLGIANYFGENLQWNEVENLGGTVNPITYRSKIRLPDNDTEIDRIEKKDQDGYSPSYISLYEDELTKNWPEYNVSIIDHPGQQVYNNLRKLVAVKQRKSDLEEILKLEEGKKLGPRKLDSEGFICFLDGVAWNFKDIALAHAIDLLDGISPRVKKVPLVLIINKFDLVKSLRQRTEGAQILDILARHLAQKISQLVEFNPVVLEYVNQTIPGYPTLQIHTQLFINEELNLLTVPFSHLEQYITNELRQFLPSFMITGEWLYTTSAQMARAIALSLMEINRDVGLVPKNWSNSNLVSDLNMRRATTLEVGIKSPHLMHEAFISKKPYGEPFYQREDVSVASQFQIPLARLDGTPIMNVEYLRVVLDSVVSSPKKIEKYINMVVEAIKSSKFKQMSRFDLIGYKITDSVSKKGIANQIDLVKKMIRYKPLVEDPTSDDLAMEKLSLDMF